MKTKLSLALLLSFIFGLLSSQVPQGFNYQAIARDAVSGNPITDPVDVKVAILSEDDPVTIIREELFEDVDPDEHGLFSIVVGQGAWSSGPVTNFSDIDWTVTPKYILTKIWYGGDWQSLGPAQLWSVPYAMYSPSTNPWSLNGSNLYYSGGNVGIGISTPGLQLHSAGSEGAPATSGVLQKGSLRLTPGHLALDFGVLVSPAWGGWIQSTNITDLSLNYNLLLNPNGGQVGIGTTNPDKILTVKSATSNTQIAKFADDGRYIGLGRDEVGSYDLSGNMAALYLNGGKLTVTSSGNVGIGTTTPNAKLQVNGDIYLPYNSGNSVLSMSMGSGNTMFFKPEDNLIRIQSDHTGNPTILWMDKFGQVGVGNNFYTAPKLILQGDNPELQILPNSGAGDRKSLINLCGTFGNAEIVGDYGARSFARIEVGSNDGQAWEGAYLRFLGVTPDIPDPVPIEVMRLNTSNGNVGIGTANPTARLAVQPAAEWSDEIPLFEVKNKHGIPVLAVYNNGVRINVEYDPDGVKGPKGGFAIGGYDYTKSGTYLQTLMNVTPDSIRFNINNNTTGKGPKGGFAIGGFGTTKGAINEDFLHITPQSSNSGNYSTKMGYEAGKNSSGPHNTFLGYFAGRGAASNGSASNIFIGEASGKNNSGGYETSTIHLPDGSVLTYFNSWGGNNVAVGNYTGVNLKGDVLHKSYGNSNVLIGHSSGFNLETGYANVLIGNGAGSSLVSGHGNIFIGNNAGGNETSSNKLYIDYTNTSTPLIYGDMYNDILTINGWFIVTQDAYKPGGGEWTASSDIRLKDVLGSYSRGLDEILALKPVSYRYKEGNIRKLPTENGYIGYVAQDVQEFLPEAVTTGKDGYLNLDMHVINVALVNAVKELNHQVESQQQQIEELKRMVQELTRK